MNIYDNVPYKTSSLPKRPPLARPDGRKVAVCIVVSAEYYEMQPPAGSFVPPNLPGGIRPGALPSFSKPPENLREPSRIHIYDWP